MSSWNILLRSFYHIKTNVLFYLNDNLIQGYIYKNDLIERFSDIEQGGQSFSLQDHLHSIQTLDQLLVLFQENSISKDNKIIAGIIDNSMSIVHYWDRSDIIKAYKEPEIKKEENETHTLNNEIPKDSLLISQEAMIQYQLATLALETFPMAILAIDTNGKNLFCNEEWLFFKKRHSQNLHTQVILKKAKDLMVDYALNEVIDFNSVFTLDNTIYNKPLYMKFLRHLGKTVGYLFWFYRENLNSKSIENNNETNEISLAEHLLIKEKELLLLAFHKYDGDEKLAAKSLHITKKEFSLKYKSHFINKNTPKEEQEKENIKKEDIKIEKVKTTSNIKNKI